VFVRELAEPVTDLKGIGPGLASLMANLGIYSVGDLLQHLPRGYEDRRTPVDLAQAVSGPGSAGDANTVAEVIAHEYLGKGPKRTLKIVVRDDSAPGALVCFGRNFLARSFPPGTRIRVHGHFQVKFGEIQASAFTAERADRPSRDFGSILPVYPSTEGLGQNQIRKAVRGALDLHAKYLEGAVPAALVSRLGFMDTVEALKSIHFPEDPAAPAKAREALAFEELFHLQVAVARRAAERSAARAPKPVGSTLAGRLLEGLPFSLTGDQRSALDQINADLAADRAMSRLLQGDVGSGKTLVALLSALGVIECGGQVAFMAPTELLARQHADTADRFLTPLGVRVALVTGQDGAGGSATRDALAQGDVDLALGTHALFSQGTDFADLRYVIVDEQHRFGVLQRLALARKGNQPDVLLMTATPIPRTLALTVFGDLDESVIREMPPGRQPVRTHLTVHGHEDRVYDAVLRELDQGHQAYIVYPLIDTSDKLALKDAESAFEELGSGPFAGRRLALIHSRIPEEEKRDRMRAFASGDVDVLVATSVVEVGVDVANATCMVIEHAERFGLAALHQLRGRVGRGSAGGHCFLVYAPELTDVAKLRLKAMKETSDGFEIAEEDLKLRGPGDLAGKRQSGFLHFRAADLGTDYDLLLRARDEARAIVDRDPGLLLPEHASLRAYHARVNPFEDHIGSL
jgi:ATP-dependent DNA helicase RecG